MRRRIVHIFVDEDTSILREDVLKHETLEGLEAVSPAKSVPRNSERSIVKKRERDQAAPEADAPAAPAAAT